MPQDGASQPSGEHLSPSPAAQGGLAGATPRDPHGGQEPARPGWCYKEHAGRTSNDATAWKNLKNPRPSERSGTQSDSVNKERPEPAHPWGKEAEWWLPRAGGRGRSRLRRGVFSLG